MSQAGSEEGRASGTTGRERSVNTLGGSVKGGEGVER